MNKIFRRNTPIPFGSDPSLAPFASRIAARKQRVEDLLAKLTGNVITIADFATGHEYFGLHRTREKWIFRAFAKFGKDTGACALTFETTKTAVQRFALFQSHFCHSFSLPSR